MSPAKSASLYLPSGYLDMKGLAKTPAPFIFVVAARGTGKTYGACDYVMECDEQGLGKFIFMRRTNTQADIIRSKEFSPFAALSVATVTKPINKYMTGVYRANEDGEAEGSPAGYICGLSTFANVRGFDAREVTTIVYDEFIPEPQEKAFAKCIRDRKPQPRITGATTIEAAMFGKLKPFGQRLFRFVGAGGQGMGYGT